MISLYDTVKLKKDRADIGVLSSYSGAVIDVVDYKGETLYTVEFFDEDGETIEDSISVYFRVDDLELVEKFKE